MVFNKRSAFLFILLMVGISAAWLVVFWQNDMIRSIGSALFLVIGGFLSTSWIWHACRMASGIQTKFWQLLLSGMVTYTAANSCWFILQLTDRTSDFEVFAYFLWIIAYFYFLASLVYKIKLIGSSISNNYNLFNIFLFIIIAVSVTSHYLIGPIFETSNYPFAVSVFTLLFPVITWSMVFFATSLVYLAKYTQERQLLLMVAAGFFLQFITGVFFAYQLITSSYQSGNIIDILWLFAVLLVGYTGFFDAEQHEDTTVLKTISKSNKTFFPFFSALFFLLLVLYENEWKLNALNLGFSITFLLIMIRQIFVIKRNEKLVKEYRYLAFHDPLTGLLNRASFKNILNQQINEAERKEEQLAVLLIDLDRFKNVNDTMGHYAGDCILKNAAHRLIKAGQNSNWIFRLGGDEFVVMVTIGEKEDCNETARNILQEFSSPFLVSGTEIILTPSVGISIYPENGKDSTTLLKNADAAMYLAKEKGRNNCQYYNAHLHAAISRKVFIENELRKALDAKQFTLYYQPRVDLHTKEITGIEALLRWKHPEMGFIPPEEFIPVAEETGQIVEIGEWVLKNACAQQRQWQKKGLTFMRIAVNVSIRQLQQSDFYAVVKQVMKETGLSPACLELEITESVMQEDNEAVEILSRLRRNGIKIVMDDFGTGYSSLHILKNLPIDILKIDKVFIEDIEDKKTEAMVKAIIGIGRNFHLDVIAEGIEKERQSRILTEYGCRYAQGYLFASPMPALRIEELLQEHMFIKAE